MILIVSHPEDEHAKGVLSALSRRRHPVTLLDTAQFPARASLSQAFTPEDVSIDFSTGGHHTDLSQCRAAWWRRPLPYTLHDNLDPEVAAFTYSECHEAFAGALALLDMTWVNPPHLDERAHHKPLQLAVAAKVGLDVPRTLITNDPEKARGFVDALGPARTIYKTFRASEDHWRETRVVHDDEVDMLDLVRFAPVIFQELVSADADIRVTIVGDRMFATSIHANSGAYSVDYRMNLEAATFRPTDLPDAITQQLKEFMRTLGIIYGAVDLLHTADGQYIFLEVNPAGEWRFVEERTGQPITTAMADLLIQLDVP